jgi:sulfur carrier protein ThiS
VKVFSMDRTVYVRLYEELNDYLPEENRKRTLSLSLKGSNTVEEAICLLGVPPEEVDLVLVNGESVPFSHIAQDGDRISIYPIFESLDISAVTRLRDESLLAIRIGKKAKDLSTKKSTLKGDVNGQEKD